MPVVSRCRCVSKSAQPRDLSDRNREKTTNASSNTIATPWLQRILLLFLSFEIRAFREMTARCSLFLFLSADTYSRYSSINGKFNETEAWSRSDSASAQLVTDFPLDGKGQLKSAVVEGNFRIIFRDRGIRFSTASVSLDTVQIYTSISLSLTDYGSHHLIVSR